MSSPLVATYSIAACDLDAGQWGVATQSKFLAVGSVVPWAEPEVGAVATQAYANPQYGPEGLFTGGLQVQTTIDPEIQAMAEQIVAQGADVRKLAHAARGICGNAEGRSRR